MAHSKQAKKRIRQNDRRRLHNKGIASGMRTICRKLEAAVEAGDKPAASALLNDALSRVDKCSKNRIVHPNAAARKKGQLTRAVNALA